eukprot:gene10020-20859_t
MAHNDQTYVDSLSNAKSSFKNLFYHKSKKGDSLAEYAYSLHKSEFCRNKPIFLTTARLTSGGYWQLVENFFYTMFIFNHINCTILVCISDEKCVRQCKDNNFPCYNYIHSDMEISTMEQVATVKIFHVLEVLRRGVDIFLLDLDVGFLKDPELLYR